MGHPQRTNLKSEKPQNLAKTAKLCATNCGFAREESAHAKAERQKPHAHKSSMGHPQRTNLKSEKPQNLAKTAKLCATNCGFAREESAHAKAERQKPHAHKSSMGHPQRTNLKSEKPQNLAKTAKLCATN